MPKEDVELPVSLELFMQCTYYEEMVKKILKAKSHGDAQKLQQFLNSNSIKQKALRNYYRAFYLEPETRRKYPIRFKPMPKKQKDKLLQYPKSKAGDNENMGNKKDCANNGDDALCTLGRSVKKIKPGQLTNQSENELMAEDDESLDEDTLPVTSKRQMDSSSISTKKPAKRSVETLPSVSEEGLKLNPSNFIEQPPAKRMKSGADCSRDNINRSQDDANKNSEQNTIETIYNGNRESVNKNVVQSGVNCLLEQLCPSSATSYTDLNVKGSAVPTTLTKHLDEKGKPDCEVNIPSVKSASSLHYSDLKKLAHHCPVTFSQFKKYTNIIQLVSHSCTRKYSNPKSHVLYWAKKIYLIYYLHPEYRLSDSLIKQIKTLANCPESLKSKIIQIPVIEEKNNENNEINEGQLDANKHEDNNNNNSDNSFKGASINVSTISDVPPRPDDMSSISDLPLKESYLGDGKTSLRDGNSKEMPSRRNSNKNECRMATGEPLTPCATTVQKNYVKILENRRLSNVPKEIMCLRLHAKNPFCKFCQVSLEDFIAKSNIKYVLENMGANNEGDIHEMYIRFMQLDENIAKMLVVSGDLMLTIFKCPTVCGECERKWLLSSPQTDNIQEITPSGSGVLAEKFFRPQTYAIEEMLNTGTGVLEERLHGLSNEQMENGNLDNENVTEIQSDVGYFTSKRKAGDCEQLADAIKSSSADGGVVKPKDASESVCNANIESQLTSGNSQATDQVVASTVIDYNNSQGTFENTKGEENSSEPPNTNKINNENALKMINTNNEWFAAFCQMLLEALREPFDYNLFPVSLQEFKLCSMYKEPLYQIICDFCGSEVELVQSFVKHTELYDSLLLYYYRKFFTCSSLRNKYPLKLKICPASLGDKMLSFVEATASKGMQVTQKGSPDNRQQRDVMDQRHSVKKNNALKMPSDSSQQIFKSPQNCVTLLTTLSRNKSQSTLKSPTGRASVRSPVTKDLNSLLQKQATLSPVVVKLVLSSTNQSEIATVNNINKLSTQLNSNAQTPPACNETVNKAITPMNSTEKQNLPETFTSNNMEAKIIDADLICLERMKYVFNDPVYRTQTLAYVLRTSFGLKQRITQMLLDLSFQEFKSLTHIYEAQESSEDDRLFKCIYDCVRKSSVWPKNLYINLEDLLLKFQQSELICQQTTEPSAILTFISPKFLHWSNLLSSTNFISCVCSYYLRRTGELLDMTNKNIVEAECKNYYNRCWIHEQWIGQTPKINGNILKTLCAHTTGDNIISTSDIFVHKVSLQPLTEEVVEQIDAGERSDNIEDIGNDVHEDKTQGKCPNMEHTEEIIRSKFVKDAADTINAISLNVPNDNTTMCEVSSQSPDNKSLIPAAKCDIQENNLESLCNLGNGSLNDTNYINIPNTQDQIGTLPSETIVPDIIDPLEDICSKSIAGCSIGGDEIITIDDLDVTIKLELESIKPLRRLMFLENPDGNIECIPAEDEVIDLDASLQHNLDDEEENLPSSQIQFGDDEIMETQMHLPANSAQKFSGDLISSGSSGSFLNLGQHVTSSNYLSETPSGSQQDMNIDLQLPGDSLLNKGGSVESKRLLIQKKLENILEISTTIANVDPVDGNVECIERFPKAQRLPSTFSDTSPTSSNDPLPMVHIFLETVNTDGTIKGITQKKIVTKTPKTDVVPQRTHPIRPLPLDIRGPSSSTSESKAHTVANTMDTNKPKRRSSRIVSVSLEPTLMDAQTKPISQDLQPATLCADTVIDNVTVKNKIRRRYSRFTQDADTNIDISREFVPAATSSQTRSTLQPQTIPQVRYCQHPAVLQPEVLRVSQELLKDCTVFNNTSLLRAVDQMSANNPSISGKFYERPLDTNNTVFNNTSLLRAADKNYNHPPEMTSKSPKKALKVNSTTTVGTCNFIVPPLKRRCLVYRRLLDFHYFHELNHKHISEYQLSTTNYGSRHYEGTILCGDLKTKLTNKSLAPLGLSCETQPDFFALLKDVGEFHYSSFRRTTIEREEDLRQRVLFWYIHTTLPFCLAQLTYDEHNSEFSECTSIQNLGTCDIRRQRPFKCLTNAISPHILNRLRKLKEDTRNGVI